MSAFKDKCRHCGKEFTNYDEHIAYRQFCSVGCKADWFLAANEEAAAMRTPEEKTPHE